MLSAISFSLDQSEILSSGNWLNMITACVCQHLIVYSAIRNFYSLKVFSVFLKIFSKALFTEIAKKQDCVVKDYQK